MLEQIINRLVNISSILSKTAGGHSFAIIEFTRYKEIRLEEAINHLYNETQNVPLKSKILGEDFLENYQDYNGIQKSIPTSEIADVLIHHLLNAWHFNVDFNTNKKTEQLQLKESFQSEIIALRSLLEKNIDNLEKAYNIFIDVNGNDTILFLISIQQDVLFLEIQNFID